jgi:AcrR family transcriptional regulator
LGILDEIAVLKRDKVMNAAVALFRERGFHGTSMDAVASALGVTKPFVYAHFKDKGDLLAAISSRGADLTLAAAETVAGIADPTERFQAFCAALARIVIEKGDYLSVYQNEIGSLSPDMRRVIERKRAEIDRRTAAMIEDGVAQGQFSVDDPLLHARAITGMLSFVHHWYSSREGESTDDVVRKLVSIATRTLR